MIILNILVLNNTASKYMKQKKTKKQKMMDLLKY